MLSSKVSPVPLGVVKKSSKYFTCNLSDQVEKAAYEKDVIEKKGKKIPEKTELPSDYDETDTKFTMSITCWRYCPAGRLSGRCWYKTTQTCFTWIYGCTDYVYAFMS